MKTSLVVFAIILLATNVFAQTKVSGKVSDASGRPVSLANISLTGTYDGTSSDEAGHFEFTTSTKGRKELQISFIGFKDSRETIELDGCTIFLRIELQEAVQSLDAVTITAGSFTAGDRSRRTIFRAVDIAMTAGATADIAGALNTLPGTQKVGETGRLFVRGGEGNETRTFIDGLVVFDAYSTSAPNIPSRARFLPFMFKGTSFSTGGYSAEYGQALSSTLVLDSKDKSEISRTDFGILSAGADVGHTEVWDRGSVGGKIQYTNLRPYFRVVNQKTDWRSPPASLEGQAAFRLQSGKYGLLKVYGNFNRSNFSLYNQSIDDRNHKERYDHTGRYSYLNGSYRNVLNGKWMIRGGISFSAFQNKLHTGGGKTEKNEHGLHAKTVFEGSLSDNLEIKTGVEIISRTYDQANNGQATAFHEPITAVFAEADVYAGRRFVSRGGLRLEYTALTNTLSLDPRFSLGYKTGPAGQVSVAYGNFRQSPKDEWLLRSSTLASEKAGHYILNYQYIQNERTFRIEGYYKRYTDLVKFENNINHQPNNSGYGFANGIELFWRDNKTVKNADYWITYSFLNTRRKYLHFPVEATPSFASTHNISLVYKHFLTDFKSQFGLTWSYTSGRRYHDPNTKVFNGNTTPAYVDLSFNWSYLPNPALIIYLSCTNLLGRDNIFGYEYSQIPNEQGIYNARAKEQPAKRFLFIGVFITLSKEKSVNQLPNL